MHGQPATRPTKHRMLFRSTSPHPRPRAGGPRSTRGSSPRSGTACRPPPACEERRRACILERQKRGSSQTASPWNSMPPTALLMTGKMSRQQSAGADTEKQQGQPAQQHRPYSRPSHHSPQLPAHARLRHAGRWRRRAAGTSSAWRPAPPHPPGPNSRRDRLQVDGTKGRQW